MTGKGGGARWVFCYQPVAQGLASHIRVGASPVPNPRAAEFEGQKPSSTHEQGSPVL